jgi:hypothetical protein
MRWLSIMRIAAKAPCRCGPLSSNVRPLPNMSLACSPSLVVLRRTSVASGGAVAAQLERRCGHGRLLRFAFRSCAEARCRYDGEHCSCLGALGKVAKRDPPATVVSVNNAMATSCHAVSPSTTWAGRRNARGSCCHSTVGASSNCWRAAVVPTFTRCLTLRSSGPAPASHLGHDALAVYHAHRGQGALLARAAQLKR